MKQKKEKISRVIALVLLLAFAGAPQFALLSQTNAQDRTINVNERIDLRALKIDNEARQISSLLATHVTFFKRAAEQRKKGGLTPREARELTNEGDQRKAELLTIKRELESLINKLKQGNHWDAAFDAQVLASLKSASKSSVSTLTQAGGARKVFQAAVGEVSLLREEIDDEVREVNTKQVGASRSRSDRAFAAHARPPVGKAGCNIILFGFVVAFLADQTVSACQLAERYNEKGCSPTRLDCTP